MFGQNKEILISKSNFSLFSPHIVFLRNSPISFLGQLELSKTYLHVMLFGRNRSPDP